MTGFFEVYKGIEINADDKIAYLTDFDSQEFIKKVEFDQNVTPEMIHNYIREFILKY